MKENSISSTDFLKLNEEDLLFITFPGRMGDTEGCSFVVENNNTYTIYRINNLHEFDVNIYDHFPKLKKEFIESEYIEGAYKKIYMGFGNLLFVNSKIYDKYIPYLDNEVEKYIDKIKKYEHKKKIDYIAAKFNEWETALIEMAKDNNIKIK